MPLHTEHRGYALVTCQVITFFLTILCGFLFGGVCVLLALLLFEPNETSTIFPPSPDLMVLLGLGCLIGVCLGIWIGVVTERAWHKGH